MFTKKHYIDISNIVKTMRDKEDRDKLIDEFIKLFSADNPHFDSDKFRTACKGSKK